MSLLFGARWVFLALLLAGVVLLAWNARPRGTR